MLNKLTITFFAGVLAVVSFPASAIDIPDYGSKNFSPTGDTPSYFAKESAPVSARTADTTAGDWTAEEAAAPMSSAAAPVASAHRKTGRHARYAAARGSGHRSPEKLRDISHSTRSAKANTGKATKTASLHAPGTQARSAKTTTTKHGRASAPHARAAIADPAAKPERRLS
jgi:hypothetical protein